MKHLIVQFVNPVFITNMKWLIIGLKIMDIGKQNFALKNSLIFNPSVGPGYIDTRVRAWNSRNTQQRREGSYYETAWRTAVAAPARIVSITSFNEWHEGTQVESAVPMSCDDYTYVSYYPK